MYTDALCRRYEWKPIAEAVRRWIKDRGCGCVELPVETVDAEFGTDHMTPRGSTLVVNASYAGGTRYFLLLKPANARADMSSVRHALGADAARAASLGEVHRSTRCRPGCVPPIGSLFELPLLIDARLARASELFVPSGQPGFTTLVRTRDLVRTELAQIVGN